MEESLWTVDGGTLRLVLDFLCVEGVVVVVVVVVVADRVVVLCVPPPPLFSVSYTRLMLEALPRRRVVLTSGPEGT